MDARTRTQQYLAERGKTGFQMPARIQRCKICGDPADDAAHTDGYLPGESCWRAEAVAEYYAEAGTIRGAMDKWNALEIDDARRERRAPDPKWLITYHTARRYLLMYGVDLPRRGRRRGVQYAKDRLIGDRRDA